MDYVDTGVNYEDIDFHLSDSEIDTLREQFEKKDFADVDTSKSRKVILSDDGKFILNITVFYPDKNSDKFKKPEKVSSIVGGYIVLYNSEEELIGYEVLNGFEAESVVVDKYFVRFNVDEEPELEI